MSFVTSFPSKSSFGRTEQKPPSIKSAKFKNTRPWKRLLQEKLRSNSPPEIKFQTRFDCKPVAFESNVTATKFPKPTTAAMLTPPNVRSTPMKMKFKNVTPTKSKPSPTPVTTPPTAPPSETNPRFSQAFETVQEKEESETSQTNATMKIMNTKEREAENEGEKNKEEATTIGKQSFTIATQVAPATTATSAAIATEMHDNDDDDDEEEEDVTDFLCLVPLVNKISDEGEQIKDVTTYWPCLVFKSLETAIQWHGNLYPKQPKVARKMSKKALDPKNESNTSVVLPLRDQTGCCPAIICRKPIYNSIDLTPKDTENKYWTTLPKRKGSVIEAGHQVIRLLHNLEDMPSYIQQAKINLQFDTIGPALAQALTEMERLVDEALNKHEKEPEMFIPSLRMVSDEEDPLRFPEHTLATPKRSTTRTSGIRFPQPSISTTRKRRDLEPTNTTKLAKKVFPRASFQSPMETQQTSTSFPSWTSPPLKPSKTSRIPTMQITDAQSSVSFPETQKGKKRKRKRKSTVIERKGPLPTVIDSKDRISVSAWAEVQPLLKELGHVFYDNLFCRPNGDPQEHPEAVEGEDYFCDMHSYRAYLCANGVEYLGCNLSDNDLELVAYWVRFHVFTQRPTGEGTPEKIEDLVLRGTSKDKKAKYVKLLQKIGYKYKTRGLFQGYCIPGEGTPRYLSEDDLWEHLAKHGIAAECESKFESKEEQWALEIEIIRKYHGHKGDIAFQIVDKLMGSNHVADHTPAANKEALEECTRANDERHEAMSPRKLMIEEPQVERTTQNSAASQSTNAENQSIAESSNRKNMPLKEKETTIVSEESHTNEADSSSLKSTEANKETTNASGESRSNFVQNSLVAKANDIVEVDIPEVHLSGTTNDEKLTSCLQNLRKNEIVAYGKLSKSMARIRNFVDTAIETKGKEGGGKSPIFYVCGNPGTGKTMSTTTLCKQAIAAKSKSMDEWEKAPRFCIISCPSLQSSRYQDGLKSILQKLKLKEKQLKRSTNDDNNAAIILILDEVDQLLGSNGAKSILEQLCSWARDENNVLSIIGISNSVSNAKTENLKKYGMGASPNKLVFETYQKWDLVKISQSKIGFSVVHQKAHEFIAAKVANSSGDARQYLDLVEKSIIYCRRNMSLEKRADIHITTIVTIRNAMMAIRETNLKCKEIIGGLTTIEQMALCAGVHLARKLDGRPVLMGKLRELIQQVVGMELDASLEEFKGVIERLYDSGMLVKNQTDRQAFTKKSMHSLLRYPVQFDLQLEDVDSALEDTLLKMDFYKRMVKRVEEIPLYELNPRR